MDLVFRSSKRRLWFIREPLEQGRLQGDALPISVPAPQPPRPSTSSRLRILKELRGVDPGWVEIIPLNRVTVHVRTWLLSAQTGTREQLQRCSKETAARAVGRG